MTVTPSLLFIPDISGFTRFVNRTEASHSRHVIAELLEVVIEADRLGMTVAEIEGDAVLFFLPDRVPTFREIVDQARATFEAFHAHLKRFERDRICECGACCSASGLSLKFVAHAGPIDTIRVAGFEKPYGSDVILAHRLLKNDIPDDEYLLLTDPCIGSDSPVLPEWATLARGESAYDELGPVRHAHVPLTGLHAGIPEPEARKPSFRIQNPLRFEGQLDLALDDAFELVSNFEYRLLWNDGVDRLEFETERVNRVGTPHRCVIQGNLIAFETTTNDFGEGRRVYGERITSRAPVDEPTIYHILEADGERTRVAVEVHYRPKGVLGPLIAPFFRLGIRKSLRRGLDSLIRAAQTFEPDPHGEA
jgi:hypothetical protein